MNKVSQISNTSNHKVKRENNIIFWYKVILVAFILAYGQLINAQQITNQLVIPTFIKSTEEPFCLESISHSVMMIEDNGRYYFKLGKCGENFTKLYDLGIVIEDFPVPDVLSSNGQISSIRESEILFEYEPGSGLVDYTIFNFTALLTEFAIDGDHLVIAPDSPLFGLDNAIIYGDTIQNDPDLGGEDIVVYDKKNDEVLYHYVDQSEENQLYHIGVGIDGDYIYVAPTFNANEMIFMGDTIQHYAEESGIQFTTLLYKINWKTGEEVWRHYIGSRFGQDKVRQIKAIDDGTLMVEIEINGPLVFDDKVYDPPYFGNGEVDLHNIAVMNITKDGEYIDHLHIHSPGYDAIKQVQIEDSGEVYAYGTIFSSLSIQIENDTFDFSEAYGLSGVFFAFDKNLDLKWSKIFTEGDHPEAESSPNVVLGANKTLDDEVIVINLLDSYLDIEGDLYVNDNIDFVNQDQNLILKYDDSGNLISKPIKFGNQDDIYDFITLDENHYLIFIWCRVQNGNATFLGEEIGHDLKPYNMILEVKGDLFENLVAIQEILQLEDFKVFPNPAQRGNYITIEIPEVMKKRDVSIEVYTLDGTKMYSEIYQGSTNSLTIPGLQLSKGLNIIKLHAEGVILSSKLLILD